jgi:NAD-dependent SIR2 family protein deacetylase
MVGYPRVRDAQPNPAHAALGELERLGIVDFVVTQNVDGLHQRAGTRNVLDLHGRLDRVVCLGCAARYSREVVQTWLEERNPELVGTTTLGAPTAPDGDSRLERVSADFDVPGCSQCGGLLKPDVVFFGEHVPPERVERANRAVEEALGLVVVGSSLMVFSGFRFVRLAARLGVPVLVVNRGITRADDLATLKLDGSAGERLQQLVDRVRADREARAPATPFEDDRGDPPRVG